MIRHRRPQSSSSASSSAALACLGALLVAAACEPEFLPVPPAAPIAPSAPTAEPAACPALRGDRRAPRPVGARPVARDRPGARGLPCRLHDDQGRLRRRGAPQLGAPRGRPLLQPREARASSTTRASSASIDGFMVQFGIPGDPAGRREVARRDHPRRPGHAVEPARLRHLRADGSAQLAHDAGLHQLPEPPAPRRVGLRPVRQGRAGHGRRRQPLQGLRRRRPPDRAPTRGASRPRATRTSTATSRSSTAS